MAQPAGSAKPAAKESAQKPSESSKATVGNGSAGRSAYRKGVLIAGAVLAVVVLLAGLQYFRTRNVYAVVGGRAITKQRFAAAKKANTSFAQKTGNAQNSSFKDIDAYTRNQLVLDAALQNEAAKAGVKVSHDDIDAQLIKVVLPGGKMLANRGDYKQAFGWTDEDVDTYARAAALENKLSGQLLNSITVLRLAAYWDNAQALPAAFAESLTKQTLQQTVPWFKQKTATPNILGVNSPSYQQAEVNTPGHLVATRVVVTGPNSLDAAERDAVAKLSNVGDYTPVTRAKDGHFYFIDRLEDKGSGRYDSWNGFQSKIKVTVFKPGWDTRRLFAGWLK